MFTSGQYSTKMIITILIIIITVKLFVHLRTILHEDEHKYHQCHQQDIIELCVHLRTILHEDEHLLPMDLDAKVVDQVRMVDRLEDTQLVGNVPDNKSIYTHEDQSVIIILSIVIIIVSDIPND